MGTHITIFEAIAVSGLSLLVFLLIISSIDYIKANKK
jgi:hypothetical protein